jgi:hypothetical protein
VGQDNLSPKRILQFLKDLDALIARKQLEARRMEVDQLGTPAEDVPRAFVVQKGKLLLEIQRLEDGRKYWKGRLDQALARLHMMGGTSTPSYNHPPPSLKEITPQELGIARVDPDYEDFPRRPLTDTPTDATCGLPPGTIDPRVAEGLIQEKWYEYWVNLKAARDGYAAQLDRWVVQTHFWEQRKRKTLRKGRPFNEPPPAKPKMPYVQPPNCPPPGHEA